jgi:hypothetical protein
MPKNPEHKKFMDQYDGLTDNKVKRVSGVENSEAQNRASWKNRRNEKKMNMLSSLGEAYVKETMDFVDMLTSKKKGTTVETNPSDGATVTTRDYVEPKGPRHLDPNEGPNPNRSPSLKGAIDRLRGKSSGGGSSSDNEEKFKKKTK